MDRGWSHGLGLFETVLAVDGRPWFLERHLTRLGKSLEAFGWKIPLDEVAAAVPVLLEKCNLTSGRARVRIALSGGVGPMKCVSDARGHHVWMVASALEEVPESVSVGISRWRRNECSPLAGHKCASYAENLFLLEEAQQNGWDEILVFNHRGHLCEAATANVFVVRDGCLITPPLSSGCLPGVTRQVVIELADICGWRCLEQDLTEAELVKCDGMFLSSATRGMVPVGKLGGVALPISPLARKCRQAWLEAGRLS